MLSKQKLNRRSFLLGSAATMSAVALAACAPAAGPSSGGGEEAAPGEEQITLNFVCDTMSEAHIKVRDKWVGEFMEANPNVTVKHQPTPWSDYHTKIQTLLAAGTPADIYRYVQQVTPIVTVHEKKMHLQLDDFIERDGYDLTIFRPDSITLYQWDGATYALPRDYGNQNFYYNKTLFEEAGVEPPPADWEDTSYTFDVFLESMQAMTQRDGDNTEVWGTLVTRGVRPMASWLYSNGGALVHKDDRGLATGSAMGEPNTVAALQFLQDLMYTHEVAPSPDVESETGGFELFASGKVAVILTNPSGVTRFRTIDSFEWDVGTIPIGDSDRRGTGGGGTGWASFAGTVSPEYSWQFIKHITSVDAEMDEVLAGATTPSIISVVNSPEFLDPDNPPSNSHIFAQAQEYVVRDPVHVDWPEILNRVYIPTLDLLWGGLENAETVAQIIEEESASLFAG
ncbi:MAG: sugar ABC transporter substrate-binding protein [Chloroflexota bacterium]